MDIVEQNEKYIDLQNNECELLKRIAEGDRKAFTVVYSRYLHGLYRYIYLFTKSKENTEEIAQAVFVKIWEQRSSLVHVINFRSYAYRCARNLLLDEIRRNGIKQKVLNALMPEMEISSEHSDSKIICSQYYQIAQEAIRLLPKKRKIIVEMRTRDELSLDEIAERLCISKKVVKKQLYAGLAFIREYFEKNAEMTSAGLLILFGTSDLLK